MSRVAPLAVPRLSDVLDLTGRTAIVTGGAMGIGLAIARRLHEAGANIAVADPDDRRSVAIEMFDDSRSGSAIGFAVDVTDEDGVDAMVGETAEHFGSVDILVNNAGIYPSCPVMEMDLKLWQRVLDINLTGLFLCTKAVAARMIEQGEGGRIVNITSIDALHPSMVGLAHYDASKHGAWGFTKNVALELAPHGIAVNAIAPGGIRTPGVGGMDDATISAFESMIPAGRMGEADEIARAALYFASDLCSYTTGSQLVVDGGRLLR
jgi:2-deoxy-D-gluconate 3-dehydrogenase